MKSRKLDIDKKFKKYKRPLNPKYIVSTFKHPLGPLTYVFLKRDMWWRYSIAVLVGIFFAVSSFFFIKDIGLYSYGFSGIFQGIARIIKVLASEKITDPDTLNNIYNALFYGLYLLANIPLIIFSYFKLGKRFTYLSTIVLIVSNVLPILMGFIPGINDIYIFGFIAPNESLVKYEVQLLTFFGSDLNYLGPLLIYAVIEGLIGGLFGALILAVSGSTGGLDFVSFYFSMKKGKPIGTILAYFNLASVFVSIFIGSYLAAGITDFTWVGADQSVHTPTPFSYQTFFSQNLVASICMSIIASLTLNFLFPKDKKVKLTIYSNKISDLRDYFYEQNFNHSITINKNIGGYSLEEKQSIDIVCLYMEIPIILEWINTVDENSLTTISSLLGINGQLNVEDSID
ncbi:MAG: YitT family protein [Mycoplasmoidaceae bacterium]